MVLEFQDAPGHQFFHAPTPMEHTLGVSSIGCDIPWWGSKVGLLSTQLENTGGVFATAGGIFATEQELVGYLVT